MIRALQLGSEDWNTCYQIPKELRVQYEERLEQIPETPYDLVFLDGAVSDAEAALLYQATKAHTLFVTERTPRTEILAAYVRCKKGKRLAREKVQSFLSQGARNYFPTSYGEKFQLKNIGVAHSFGGTVVWSGNYCVTLEGTFGETFCQSIYWRNNIPMLAGQAIELWLEYETTGNVEIALEVTLFRAGSISEVEKKWHFSEEELQKPVILDDAQQRGMLFFSLQAKGVGTLCLIALHDRYSRRGHGCFLPGGQRYVTEKREEIFHYFDPGDRKPPLAVYFSEHKTQEGFQGYWLMRSLQCPFLLIAEQRLTGGAFYMGDAEYEAGFVKIIEECMQELSFSPQQVILSGISMGGLASVYYGCDLSPHAMIVGKPLFHMGDVAGNERLHRPGGFPESLDILQLLGGGGDAEAIARLNERFWKKFAVADWGKSKFFVAHMLEDDYESNAYEELLAHLNNAGVQVYGKGIHGRHNDATREIVRWFRNQYQKVLAEDFGREQ